MLTHSCEHFIWTILRTSYVDTHMQTWYTRGYAHLHVYNTQNLTHEYKCTYRYTYIAMHAHTWMIHRTPLINTSTYTETHMHILNVANTHEHRHTYTWSYTLICGRYAAPHTQAWCTHKGSDIGTSPFTYTGMYTKNKDFLTHTLPRTQLHKQAGGPRAHSVWTLKVQGKSEVASMA